jgi:hypothetical protein
LLQLRYKVIQAITIQQKCYEIYFGKDSYEFLLTAAETTAIKYKLASTHNIVLQRQIPY